jgi:phage terminase small subunit
MHKLRGSFRRDRHANAADVSADGAPEMPRGLDRHAKTLWKFLAGEAGFLVGVARRRDTPALTLLCRTWSLLCRSLDAANEDPLDKNTRVAVTSYSVRVEALFARFGLTPSDRAKLRVEPAPDQGDAMAGLIHKMNVRRNADVAQKKQA